MKHPSAHFRSDFRVMPAAIFLAGWLATVAHAEEPLFRLENPERDAGDILKYALPAIGLGMALHRHDNEGVRQWAYTVVASELTTEGLKAAVNSTDWGTRPNGGKNSFPSGHATTACAGAAFIDRRYGHKYGAPATLPAAFVAYTRVDLELHHWRDVIAGCAIGAGFAAHFTSPESPQAGISPVITREGVSLGFSMKY